MILTKEDIVSFIIGMCLGDSNLSIGKNAVNYNINCTHSPRQYDYLIWKMEILKENLQKGYWIRKEKSRIGGKAICDGNRDKEYDIYRGTLGTHTLATHIHNLLYVNNKKIVPMDALNLLTPIGLAVWYMDDGNLAYQKDRRYPGVIASRNVTLHIQGFDCDSQNNIIQYFQENLGLDARLHKARDKFKLWMNTETSIEFLKIVAPYVNLVECMRYKIDLKYKKKNIDLISSVEPAMQTIIHPRAPAISRR